MRRVVVERPDARDICPGWKWWQRYRGEEWLVFIDESFRGFFELVPTGYFAHAAVGVPEREYPALKAALEPIFQEFARLTGQQPDEFKYADWRRLSYRDRRRLALHLRDSLVERGCFIAGFFTPVRAFVLERVRTELLGKARELPADIQPLYEEAVRKLKAKPKGPGQSSLLKTLMALPCMGSGYFLSSLDAGFRILCDPRERKEDQIVQATVSDIMALTRNLEKRFSDPQHGHHRLFRGIDSSKRSEEEVGLQLADLVVGEVRDFFQANPEVMSFGASKRLITQASEEPRNAVMRVDGHLAKTAALHRLHPGLHKRFFKPDPAGRTVLPFFSSLQAAGILTCYSVEGQPRDLHIFEKLIWDQTDS